LLREIMVAYCITYSVLNTLCRKTAKFKIPNTWKITVIFTSKDYLYSYSIFSKYMFYYSFLIYIKSVIVGREVLV